MIVKISVQTTIMNESQWAYKEVLTKLQLYSVHF